MRERERGMSPSCLLSAIRGLMEAPRRLLSGDGWWWGGGVKGHSSHFLVASHWEGGSGSRGAGGAGGGGGGGRGGVGCLWCGAEEMSQSYKLTAD